MGLIFAEPHDTEEYSATAALLLAMAEEQGLHPRVVETVLGGFLVPESISDLLKPEPSEPPVSWSEPLPEVNVFMEDGKYFVLPGGVDEQDVVIMPDDNEEPVLPNAAGREEIRAWGVENGHSPAASGKLKASLVEAFRVANPERATAE